MDADQVDRAILAERSLRAGPSHCVACGREVELTPEGYANHKCCEPSEAARRAADSRARDGFTRTPPLWERLQDGFSMLQEDEDDGG